MPELLNYVRGQYVLFEIVLFTCSQTPKWTSTMGSTLLPEAAKHETGFHSDTSGKIYLRSLWKLILANYLRAVHQDLRAVHQDLREGTKREVKHEKKKNTLMYLSTRQQEGEEDKKLKPKYVKSQY